VVCTAATVIGRLRWHLGGHTGLREIYGPPSVFWVCMGVDQPTMGPDRKEETRMTVTREAASDPTPQEPAGGLLLSRSQILDARSRGEMPSDGGSTGRSDTND